MTDATQRAAPPVPGVRGWLAEAQTVDRAVYAAVAGTSTPHLDDAMRRLSRAANYSRLSMAASVLLAAAGGASGRRAAGSGMAAVAATSGVVNLVVKPLARRHRPDSDGHAVPAARRVRTPASGSFPSGHTAAAVAFASAVGREIPAAGLFLRGLATLVGYSRVHTGVHYPGDVIAGAVVGAVTADLTSAWLNRTWPRHSSASSS